MDTRDGVRRYVVTESDARVAYVIGHGIGCSRHDMERWIIPEVKRVFPSVDEEEIALVVILMGHGVKGQETVFGLGLRIPVPEQMTDTEGYVPFPSAYEIRGSVPKFGESECFEPYRDPSGTMAFYTSHIINPNKIPKESIRTASS